MNQQTSPLEQLSEQFEAWRNNRLGHKATPQALRQQTVNLKSSYPISQIIAALGINHSTLKRWSANKPITSTPEFISLPPEIVIPQTTTDVLCELPNGIRLTLNSQTLTQALLSTLTQLNTQGQP